LGPKVVVIGAGVVGAALVDELSAKGWTDITIVDQGVLPAAGGSSSHAPGLVFQVNGAKVMTSLARSTVRRLGELEVDGEPCFLPTGSIEVATTPERLAELHRRQGWAASWGLESAVLTPAETVARHDLLDPAIVLGGLYVPTDGLAKALRTIEAQLRLARDRGVRVLDRHEVLSIRTQAGRVTGVVTEHGELDADLLVCCAGIWGPRIARMVGIRLPLTPLAHQFAWSSPLPELAGAATEATRPILRHQSADLYLRERGDQMGIGYYGHDPMPVEADDIRSVAEAAVMPSIQDFTPDDYKPGWADAQALLPALRRADVAEGMNGLFSFTPDNMPLLGESAQVKGFWVAEAVWVTHSAGVGRAMAEWLVDGYCTSFDLHECDINRFEPHQLSPTYVLAKNRQNYVEVYDALHPLEPMLDPRPMRTSPFHPCQVELGAYFLEASGWERPQWYEANASLLDRYPIERPNDWAAKHWSPIVGAEALATRDGVALFDMTTLKRLEVAGPGATALLQWLTTGDVDRAVGTVTYCLLLDLDGGIRSDITVARLGPELYQVGANGNLDLDWFTRHGNGSVSVRDITAGTCCVGVWGPRARDVVQALTVDDFSDAALRYFGATTTHLRTSPVTALRLSYVGELGYELYTTADCGLALWQALWEAGRPHGIIAAGRGAFTALRLEKGYRSFGVDMTYEHDPYEAGLGFAVKLHKPDFLGRDALVRRSASPPSRRLACLTIEGGPSAVVAGKEPVYDGTRCVGHVTSAAYGYTIAAPIAYAWLPAELAVPGRTVQIGYFDQRLDAVVRTEPLFDPGMARLRG
jgi:glycine cleavage system aminomethyltransferase T/glycine/D-amino acid oxidase-like deaminating enzyme